MTRNGTTDVESILRNALVFDGENSPPFRGDIAIADGRIVEVADSGKLKAYSASTEVDLRGLALAPGFIDAHTHDDVALLKEESILPKLTQGVTTVVTGNCGISIAPVTFESGDPPPPMNLLGGRDAYVYPTMAEYRDRLRLSALAVNVLALVGHSSLRLRVMDDVSREADVDEISQMRNLLRSCLKEGASGFSTGLYYAPNLAATTTEVSAVSAVVAEMGGVYATHMRSEGDGVVESIHESCETARKAGVPLLISHHKCAGRRNWGRTSETLPLIGEYARAQPVNFDVYPYAAGSTILTMHQVSEDDRVMVTWSHTHPEYSGRDLSEIARDWNVNCKEAASRLMPAGAIYFQMHEDDVQEIIASKLSIIGSDGIPNDNHPHPRLWGTFPRVLGRYARELGLISMQSAINKMTGSTARIFGLEDRGRIDAGFAADLVAFDPDTVIDRATYENPVQPCEGIKMVWVNGKLALKDGLPVDTGAGHLLASRHRGINLA